MQGKSVCLVLAGLNLFGLTACAEEPRMSHNSSVKLEKNSPDTLAIDLSKAKRPLPSQKMLEDVLSKTTSIRLLDCALDQSGRLIGESGEALKEISPKRVVFESSEPMVMTDVKRLLSIREGSEEHFSLNMPPTLELTLTNGKIVYLGVPVSFVRWNEWRYDGSVSNNLGLLLWLAQHGFSEPARRLQTEIDLSIYKNERKQKSFDEFVRAMPKSLITFLGSLKRLESSARLEDMSERYGKLPEGKRLRLARFALSREFPQESDQIRALLEWEGELINLGVGSYEDFPIELLMSYEPSHVLSKVRESSLSPAQWVGLSRFYSSNHFKQKFPSGYIPLDQAMRQRILEAITATGTNESDVENFRDAMSNW